MSPLNLKQAVVFLLLFQVSYCQRRIVNGEQVREPKRYVVYLIESSISPIDYDEWMCGGALVTSDYIITSAACVEDVKHLYAIAGYEKYVSKEEIYEDKCTCSTKKKIIFTCVPRAYEMDYSKLEKWSFIDIAVAQVESPYRIDDKDFQMLCSYIPVPIEINFETKYQVPGIDAIALGWGHSIKWRTENDRATYNNVTLQYTPILIADKEECKKEYEKYKGMVKVIDTYMICSTQAGNIDSKGALREKSKPVANGCPGFEEDARLLFEKKAPECDRAEGANDMSWVENARRNNLNANNDTVNEQNIEKFQSNISNVRISETVMTRRNGICQNDHGGPIVTWIGSEEYLIGVASVFKVNSDMECTGPYLYTSTECNGAFLACVLGLEKNEETRRKMCSGTPAERGFDMVETHISWRNHPDGPSEKERFNETLTNTTEVLPRARPSEKERFNETLTNTTEVLPRASLTGNETSNASVSSKTEPTKTTSADKTSRIKDVVKSLHNFGLNSKVNTTTSSTKRTVQQPDHTQTRLDIEGSNTSKTFATTPILATRQTVQQNRTRWTTSKNVNASTTNTTKIKLTIVK